MLADDAICSHASRLSRGEVFFPFFPSFFFFPFLPSVVFVVCFKREIRFLPLKCSPPPPLFFPIARLQAGSSN